MNNKRFEKNLADLALQRKIHGVKSSLGNKNGIFEKNLQSCICFLYLCKKKNKMENTIR